MNERIKDIAVHVIAIVSVLINMAVFNYWLLSKWV